MVMKWAKSAGPSLRVALVARPELIDPQKIGVLMRQNRGVSGDVFPPRPTRSPGWMRGSARGSARPAFSIARAPKTDPALRAPGDARACPCQPSPLARRQISPHGCTPCAARWPAAPACRWPAATASAAAPRPTTSRCARARAKRCATFGPEHLIAAPGEPQGTWLMGYDAQGHCPMYRAGGCSIYSHRPDTCRTYDCRIFSAAGMDAGDGRQRDQRAHRALALRLASDAGRQEHRAVTAAANFLRQHPVRFPDGHIPSRPAEWQCSRSRPMRCSWADGQRCRDGCGHRRRLQEIRSATGRC